MKDKTINATNWKNFPREERGRYIAKTFRITKTEKGYKVPSQSGSGYYYVKLKNYEPECNCPDCKNRNLKCKHIWAVEFYVKEQINSDGTITQERGIRVTYSQDWSAYTKAQTSEKRLFMELLADLTSNIKQPEYNFGRPQMPYSDMVFSSALKVYSTFSLRRFMCDMETAREKGHIDKTCSYVTVSNYMNKEELTPILKELIKLSSKPLVSVEKDFAVDSSGFSTSRFARWFDKKWGKDTKKRIWLKAHLISGVKTNIVTGVEITEGTGADSKEFINLVEQTAENFSMEEVSADKAYSSRNNLKAVEDFGAVPFIPFKKNTTGKRVKHSIWRKMYHYFMFNNEEFLEHYNKRSNSETVFHMIKTKFGDSLKSKNKTSQVNELLLKVLCHNICVLIQEMHELGIEVEF